MSQRWIAVGVPSSPTDGGSLRAIHLFSDLVERTDALSFFRPDVSLLRAWRRLPRFLAPGAHVASAELLPGAAVWPASRLMNLRVLDLHDDPVLQAAAMGLALTKGEIEEAEELKRRNLAAFDVVVGVSDTFAELAEIPGHKRFIIPNGTDTSAVTPGPWPTVPRIGFVSGAAPGRGIELLVESVRELRSEIPAELELGLVSTGEQSAAYLRRLTNQLAHHPWVRISTVGYDRLSSFLSSATVLVVPHPPGAYMDAALPVKLFDSMAAGRPVVVTPRVETTRVISDAEAGIVAAGDTATDLAAALQICMADEALARRLGANARMAAEGNYDWRVLARRLSARMLA